MLPDARPVRLLKATTAALVAVGLVSCSSGTPTDPQGGETPVQANSPARNPAAYSAVPITGEQVDRAVGALPDIVDSVMADTGIPGMAVGVTHRGRTVFAEGFGVRKVGETAAVDADTVFQLASVSKPIGATVVAREVSKGTVRWDTPVAEHLPGFTLADPWVGGHVTIGDLYAHRSGLPDHAGDDLEEIGYGRDDVITRLGHQPLESFRASYAYTNFGLTAGAEAVARAGGQPWEVLSERNLYEPLGMTATSSRLSDFLGRSNRAVPHVFDTGSWQPTFQREPDAQSPAGGVSSSVTDLTKWMRLVLGEGSVDGQHLIDPAALVPALTPQVMAHRRSGAAARTGFYGYGFNVGIDATGRTVLSHSGAFSLGSGTAFSMLPSEDIGIVVLTNAAPVGAPEIVTNQFMDLVTYGEPTFDWPSIIKPSFVDMGEPFGELVDAERPTQPAPARDLSAYAGIYRNDYFGEAVVEQTPSGLALVLGPAPVRYPLEHWDGDVFTFDVRSENAEPGSISKVSFSGAGQANGMVIEYFDKTGLGTFIR